MPSTTSHSPAVLTPKQTRTRPRSAIGDILLDSLEALVVLHRALRTTDQDAGLHTELIAAEVAHHLEMARSALRRTPPLGSPAAGGGR